MRRPAGGSGQGAAVGQVLAAVASIQGGAAVAVGLFDRAGAVGAVALRLTVAALLLAPLAVLGRWRSGAGRPPLRDLRVAGVFGLVLAAMNTTFYLSLERLPLGVAVTIELLGPLTLGVVLAGRRLDWVWAGLGLLGTLLLTGVLAGRGLDRLDPVGVALALLAGALWAGYILASQATGRRFADGTGLAVASVVAAVLTLPLGLATAGGDLLRPEVLAVGAAVGVLSSALPYALELRALRRLPAATFGVLMSLEPAAAALAGLLVLGQRLAPVQVLAIGLVVVASAGAAVTASPPGVPAPD